MRRALIRALRALLVLLGGLALLATATVVFFMTTPGEALLKQLLVERVNGTIQGHVTVGELSFGGDSLALGAVQLAAPNGREVLAIQRLGADVEVTSLLRGRLVLDRVSAVAARARLQRTPEGDWSLARALSSRHPCEPSERSRWPDVGIEEVALEGSQVELTLPMKPANADSEALRVRGLDVHGRLRWRDQRLDADLAARGQLTEPGQAPIDARLRARDESGEQRIEVQGSLGAASARFVLRSPDGATALDGDAAALERISAAASVDAPAVELGGLEYGPLRLDAQLQRGRLLVPVLELVLPGLRLTRREPAEDTAIAARLELESLSTLGRALRPLTGRELALAGHGELHLALAGTLLASRAHLSGTLQGLHVGVASARSLSIDAAAPPFGDGAPAPGHVRVEAEGLTLNDLAIGPTVLDARLSERGHLTLSAEAGSAPALRIHAEGRHAATGAAVHLEALEVAYERTAWRLASAPAEVRWGDGVSVELALQSRQQRIELDLDSDSVRTALRAELANVRLASVPVALVDAPWGRRAVGGTLDARLVAERSGVAEPWTGEAHAALSEGRWGRLRGVAFRLDARAADGRARGSFEGKLLSGRARGDFDLPASWPPSPGAPVQMDARLAGLRLAGLHRALGPRVLPSGVAARIQSVSGALAVRGQIHGRWPRPRLTSRLEIAGGAVTLRSGERYRDIELTADATPDWISVHPLVVRSEEGELVLRGYAGRRGSSARFRVEAQGRGGLPIPDAPLLLSNARVTSTGTLSARRLTLKVTSRDVQLVEARPSR